MSLLQKLPYRDYQKASELSLRQCEVIAKLAGVKISFEDAKNPGEKLIKLLDRYGYAVEDYMRYLNVALTMKTFNTYYKPHSKVAILIANDRYEHLSNLSTPVSDCNTMADLLRKMGFIVIIITNTTSKLLKRVLSDIFHSLERNSYCFVFYAGHGCQLVNTKCIMGVDCPPVNIRFEHCVTENFIIHHAQRSRLDLCILILDSCRMCLDRQQNPDMYSSIQSINEYSAYNNLIIVYTTQPTQGAYEVLQIECSSSSSIPTNATYELRTEDMDRITPGFSLYGMELCKKIAEDMDVSTMLDVVAVEIEKNSVKKQRPTKIQIGFDPRSLHDPTSGDIAPLLETLTKITNDFTEHCSIFNPTSVANMLPSSS